MGIRRIGLVAASWRSALRGASVLWLLVTAAFAEAPVSCADGMFAVSGSEAELAARLCQMASEVRGRLAECGLSQTRPLTIDVTDEVDHPMGNCLAYFDCDDDLVRITDPAGIGTKLEGDAIYAALPPLVTLEAILTHELAHALVWQSAGDHEVPLVDQEYVAAAMELELMDDAWREVFLAEAAVSMPPKEGLIDIWIYGFAPRKFAVNAWQHFRQRENGCAFVRKLVAGEESFHKPLRPELR